MSGESSGGISHPLVETVLTLLRTCPQAVAAVRDKISSGDALNVKGVAFRTEWLQEALSIHLGPAIAAGVDVCELAAGPAIGIGSSSSSSGIVAMPAAGPPAAPEGVLPPDVLEEPPLPPPAAPPQAVEEPAVQLVLSPHSDGKVRLRWHPGFRKHELIHVSTGERKLLPSDKAWEMDIGDDGYGMVFEIAEDPAVHRIEDLLEYNLYQKCDDDLEKLILATPAPDVQQRLTLRQLQSKHTCGVVSVRVGATACMDEMQIAVFDLHRQHCRVWWSVLSVKNTLNMCRSNDNPGEFVQKYIDAWNQFFDKVEVSRTLRSQQYAHSRLAHGEDLHKVLKFPTFSSCSLLAMLARWAWAPKGRGKLNQPHDRLAAENLFVALVKSTLPTGAQIQFWVNQACHRSSDDPWPLGRAACETLAISPTLLVDVGGLLLHAEQLPRKSTLDRIVSEFRADVQDNQVPLAVFVGALLGLGESSSILSVFKQIVWVLGDFLDVAVSQGQEEQEGFEVHLQTQACANLECMEVCARYWQGCSDHWAAAGSLHLSGSVDKSRVHSMGLLNGAWADPSGHCWWGVPQELNLLIKR